MDTTTTANMIGEIEIGDHANANVSFAAIMQSKLDNALAQARHELSQRMFVGTIDSGEEN